MAGVNYKIGADSSAFKQGVSEAQASLKTLDAALKVNEASFKAGGDAEVYMTQKTQLLSDKMTKQKQLVTQLQQGLKQMRESGVAPTSVEYQQLETRLLNAQTAMLSTQSAIDGLDEKQTKAAGSAGALTSAVNGISKKISLEQVISGIDSITGALETAGRAAKAVGDKIWGNIVDAAKLSDDYATMASTYGVDVETIQKQVKVFDTMADTSIEAFYKAKARISKAISSPSAEQLNYFEMLGLASRETLTGKYGEQTEQINWMVQNGEDALWEVGQRLKQAVESGKINQDMADTISQAFFSRGFQELNPLFDMGKEAFQEAVDAQTAASEKAIENNAKFNDSIDLLKKDWETFKIEIVGSITPALTDATTSLSGLINSFTEYAKSEDGQKLLQSMGDAATALFKDLSEIDPEAALEGFTGVFTKLTSGLEWLTTNSGSVVKAMEVIVGGWAALELTGGALKVWQLVQGISGLTAGAGAAATAGAAAGASWGGAFATAVATAAPWLIGLYTLLNPSPGDKDFDTLTDENGNLTEGGRDAEARAKEMAEISNTVHLMTEEEAKAAETRKKEAQVIDLTWENISNTVKGWLGIPTGGGGGSSAFEPPYAVQWEEGGAPGEALRNHINSDDPINLPVKADVIDDAADLAAEIGTVDVPVRLVLSGAGYGGSVGGGVFDLMLDMFGRHANGLWSVPFDNYPALLHRGERVVPAREVSSRSYNSNLYVEKMIMNNGTDAQGLAAAMAAAQRRRMSGYGS